MAAPGVLDLVGPRAIKRGDTYDLPLVFTTPEGAAIDLTGRAYSAQVRRHPDATEKVDFTVELAEAVDGRIILHLDPDDTTTMTSGVWDLQETISPTEVRTVVQGAVTVTLDVTRG